jgi:hypothetical protein
MEKRKYVFIQDVYPSIKGVTIPSFCCYYSNLHEVHEWSEVPLEKNDVARLQVWGRYVLFKSHAG